MSTASVAALGNSVLRTVVLTYRVLTTAAKVHIVGKGKFLVAKHIQYMPSALHAGGGMREHMSWWWEILRRQDTLYTMPSLSRHGDNGWVLVWYCIECCIAKRMCSTQIWCAEAILSLGAVLKQLTPSVYDFVSTCTVQQQQPSELSQDGTTEAAASLKNEERMIPDVIFNLEVFEKHLIQITCYGRHAYSTVQIMHDICVRWRAWCLDSIYAQVSLGQFLPCIE